jgi:hypothetical protein
MMMVVACWLDPSVGILPPRALTRFLCADAADCYKLSYRHREDNIAFQIQTYR